MPKDLVFSNLFNSNPLSQLSRLVILKPLKVAAFGVSNTVVCIGSAILDSYFPGCGFSALTYTSGALAASSGASLVYEYARLVPFMCRNINPSIMAMDKGNVLDDEDKAIAKVIIEDGLPIIQLFSKEPYVQGKALALAMEASSIDAFHRYYSLIFPLIRAFHNLQRLLRREVVDYKKHGGMRRYVEQSILDLNFPEDVLERYRGFVNAIMFRIEEENKFFVAQDHGITLNYLMVLMATPDIFKMLACSAHVINYEDGTRTLGRNLDWYGAGVLPRHTVGIVYPVADEISRRSGVSSWFSISFAPGLPSLSGYNGHICMTLNEATSQLTKNQFAGGLPMLIMFRKIMENCKTIEEVESFLEENPPATSCLLTIMSKDSEAIVQVLPTKDYIEKDRKFSILRRGDGDRHISVTNHFIEDGKVVAGSESWPDSHNRKLRQDVAIKQLRPSDSVLESVNEVVTMQSMVFTNRRSDGTEGGKVDMRLKVGHGYAATSVRQHEINVSRLLRLTS